MGVQQAQASRELAFTVSMARFAGNGQCGLEVLPDLVEPGQAVVDHSEVAQPRSAAAANTAHTRSPKDLTIHPPFDSIARRKSASCRASAPCMGTGRSSHIYVLPSISVNRKVTVPVGNHEFAGPFGCMPAGGHASAIQRAHHVAWVAIPCGRIERKLRIHGGKLRRREPDREGADILV